MIFNPIKINKVDFKNRILRSSLGGKTAYYDGSVSPAWRNFEKHFAGTGVAGIISATIDIDERRLSPLEYPKISHDRFVPPMREGVREVQEIGSRYIMQIGDPGGQTQTSLFSEEADGKSASNGFDLLYGYRNRLVEMTHAEVLEEIDAFGEAARRVRDIGCDGVEVTASKGYIIHQFLNPVSNRRKDEFGGSVEKRFRLLREVVQRVRKVVGPDFLFGIRLSAMDFNYLPLNIRWPIVFPLRNYFFGNGLKENLYYAAELERLGIDYLHIDSGFGFINPKGNPGTFPLDGIKLFANSTRHLSFKANCRASLVNILPGPIVRAVLGFGWKFVPAANAPLAAPFKKQLKIPIISNGGFQRKDVIEQALGSGQCDMVAIGRPLLANSNLLQVFAEGKNEPDVPCTFCNRCCTRTAVLPLGCYDHSRFSSQEEMERQIIALSGTPDHANESSTGRAEQATS